METVETSALSVATSLLSGSDMIVALPEELVQPELDSGVLAVLPFELGLSMDVYGIVTRKRHQLSPGAQAMLGALRKVAWQRYGRAKESSSGF